MIYTSYFAKYKGKNGVCISRYVPKWYAGQYTRCFAPSAKLLKWWKGLSEEEHTYDNYQLYIKRYREETLKPLTSNIDSIYKMYDGKVLLCYEKSTDFCHRHIVASWFREYGYKCEELQGEIEDEE